MIEAYKKNFGRAMLILRAVQHLQITGFAFSAHVLIFFAYLLLDGVFERILSATGSMDVFTISVILLLIFFAYGVAAFLPSIALTVRRLRDAGYNWPYIFISLIPFVGPIIFIVLLCKPTKVDYPFNNFNNPQQ